MHVVVILAFILSLSLSQVGQAVFSGPLWVAAVAVGVYLLTTAAIARLRTVISLHALNEGDLPSKGSVRRYNLLIIFGQLWLIGGQAGLILLGYDRWVMTGEGLGLAEVPLIGTLMLVLPFIVALMLTWWLEYPYSTAVREILLQRRQSDARRRPWTLGEHIIYNTRHQLLFILVPVSLIILLMDLLDLYIYPQLSPAGQMYAIPAIMLGGVIVIFIFAPLMIVRIWRTSPLESGPLRDKLEELCKRMKVRAREILIWQSGGMIANAGVMGLFAPVRYILVSDAMLENMSAEHIRAIFAHEAGHVRGWHILYYLIFAKSAMLLSFLVGEAVVQSFGAAEWLGGIATLGILVVVWGVGFGWISRRFERQSDVVGAWLASQDHGGDGGKTITPGGAATFNWALQQVASLNGIPASQRSWRHGSIDSRIGYIYELGLRQGSRGEIDLVVRRIKIALWIVVAALLASLVAYIRFTGSGLA